MSETLSEEAFSEELRPVVEDLYNQHLQNTKPWSTYEEIDWSQGVSYKEQPWNEADYPLDDAVRSAIHINLLTEDNAPYYTHLIKSRTPEDHPLQAWNGQWTMEEGQHSFAIRSWATVTRAVDPAILEAARREQMAKGVVPQPQTMADVLAYVPFQEKATQVAHRNTSRRLSKDDEMGKNVLGLVAGDEGRHYIFYKNLAHAAFQIDPSTMMKAVSEQVRTFEMPGTGIPDFQEHADKIAKARIYDLGHFKNNVVDPTLKEWKIEEVEGLDDEAEIARDELLRHVVRLGKAASYFARKNAA